MQLSGTKQASPPGFKNTIGFSIIFLYFEWKSLNFCSMEPGTEFLYGVNNQGCIGYPPSPKMYVYIDMYIYVLLVTHLIATLGHLFCVKFCFITSW